MLTVKKCLLPKKKTTNQRQKNKHKRTAISGHSDLHFKTGTGIVCAGEIWRNGAVFYSNENSGHYGFKWHDGYRVQFLKLMQATKLEVHHEPWIRDSVLRRDQPELYAKKINGTLQAEEGLQQGFEVLQPQDAKEYQSHILAFSSWCLHPFIALRMQLFF